VFAGVRFLRGQPVVLGAITLDLFAVLLGGAVALLPVYARDILHAGPIGFGVLRAAPALGATTMAIWLAFNPIGGRAGKKMFAAVALFGVATIVFGVSTNVLVSVGALALSGAADELSVVVRQTLIQLGTPDAMRGRVSAVNFVFIGISNEIGELESGLAAAAFGTVPAVVLGGLGTLAVVCGGWFLAPALRDVDQLERRL
jgi:MFS family permease